MVVGSWVFMMAVFRPPRFAPPTVGGSGHERSPLSC